jgi:hypothetical protein
MATMLSQEQRCSPVKNKGKPVTVTTSGLAGEAGLTRKIRSTDVAVKVELLRDWELETKDEEEQELVWHSERKQGMLR